MARIGVLCVHGMGNQPPSFADGLFRELLRRLPKNGVDPALFAFRAAWWGRIMEGAEEALFESLERGGDLDWKRLRRDVVLSGFGDALAYVGPPNRPSAVYDDIHAVLAESLEDLARDMEDPERSPLVVLAHSLGCAIASDYLWDAQHGRFARGAASAFARGATLAGLVTFGCNLPLFTLAYERAEIQPIAFPGAEVGACFPGRSPEEVRAACKWLNFYDPDDILGWPLRPINRAYAAAVTEDVAIDTGTIGAHGGYWTDNDFTKPVARFLAGFARLLEAERAADPAA